MSGLWKTDRVRFWDCRQDRRESDTSYIMDMLSSIGLSVRDVRFSRKRGGFELGPITSSFSPGLTSIVGANGAGKSTFFKLVSGQLKPRSGEISVHGEGGIGYLSQSPEFPRQATVREFLTYVAWIYHVDRQLTADRVATTVSATGLEEKIDAPIRSLSGGMQRRLGIAQAIIHNPAVLLLDEPTVGLDPIQRLAIRELIDEISARHVVLMATHLVDDVSELSNRILVFRDGQIAFDGSPEQLEERGSVDAPGHTALERGLTSVMGTLS